jgi:hypothetical protein
VLSFINFQKERDKGAADGIVTPSDASALGFTLATTSAQQLGVTDVITDVARGIFNAWRKRPEEGKFAVTSDIAEFMHDDTAASRQWTRTTVEFKLKGSAPSSDIKDLARLDPAAAHVKVFKFLLDFEHNGYDIKNAQVTRVIQGSSPMKRGQFTCEFKAKNATSTTAEMARIEFLLTGKWDPGLGSKFYDFKGKLHLEADGDFGFTLDKNERVSIDFVAGATFANMKRVPGTAPKNQVQRTVVFFAKPGSDVVSEKEMTRVKRWIRELQQTAKVRYDRLRAGKLPIYVEGHASPTGKGQMNQDLSRRRMEKVAKLVRDELGSEAKVITSARGEADPAYKDTRSDENDFDRRVDIWIEVSGVG